MNSNNHPVGVVNIFFPNRQQFLESALPQEFSLPIPIMKYIWENPSSPEVYHKLIQSCKLFFVKNPILVLKNLFFYFIVGWRCCNANECDAVLCKQKHEQFDMDKLPGKIWLSKRFHLNYWSYKCSAFITKIYRYNVEKLSLYNQNFSYDELKFLSNGVKECSFQAFAHVAANAACTSYENLIDACHNIEDIAFNYISDVFVVPTFYQHLKKSKNRCSFYIFSRFNHNLLDEIINEILETESFQFVPPVIYYHRLDNANCEKMKEIQAVEIAKRC